MAPRIGPSDADRYGWPGVPPGTLAEAAGPIARHIVRAHARTVGFVPAGGTLTRGESLSPLVVAVAEALLGFLVEDVALIDSWPTWPWGEAFEPGDRSVYRQRRLAPRLIEIGPLPCGDQHAAAVALQATLEARPASAAVVLANLADYAKPGVLPSVIDLVDGVVLVAARRRTWGSGLGRMGRSLAADKRLGVVLVR